jgi:ArsR family metal-binding transcriptional regulator
MLLKDCKLGIVLSDCNPSSQKVKAIADLSENIGELLPYLNTVLKGLRYDGEEKILTINREESQTNCLKLTEAMNFEP